MAKKSKKIPSWLRAVNLLVGFITLLLSLVVLANPGLAITTLIILLAITLLIMGGVRVFTGFLDESLSDKLRAFNIFIGLFSFMLAFIVIIFSGIATMILIYFLSFNLLLNGLARFVIGGSFKGFPNWLRGFLVIIGAVSIIFSFIIFLYPDIGVLTLVFILSIALLLNGISRIVRGITGRKK